MRHLLFVSVVALFTCAAGALAAEMVPNPAYASWAKHKVGTNITFNSELSMMGETMKSEVTQKLASLDAEKAVVEMKVKSNGRDMPGYSLSIPAQIEKGKAQDAALPPGLKGEVRVVGKEKLTLAGKELDCQVMEFSSEQQGKKLTGKSWICPEVPGTLVKSEMALPGSPAGKQTMTLSALDLR